MGNGSRETAIQWVFGTSTTVAGTGAMNNVLGSTGAGVSYNVGSMGASFTASVETDAVSTCSYQLRAGRTNVGPWAVLSSGTLGTNASDIIQLPGPFRWLSPRVKTLNSTANMVVVRVEAV